MIVWCIVLFLLGVTAWLDSVFNFGQIYRSVNSVLFLLISLGLLVRVKHRSKIKEHETLQKRITELEHELGLDRVRTKVG
ncbi:MAG: hypothetical protein L0Y74_07165 [candidate division Zixibacteria bacterium]|nr:hypothetical protein [candidate division Zixibacteria bacterium]